MFTIVAERINMTRTRIAKEVRARNAAFIAKEARLQTDAGATHIDVNAGGSPETECDDMAWLTKVVSEATQLPLCFDSANPGALRVGLAICNRPGTIVNSISGERERIEGILPLVKEFGTGVVALTMDDDGMPEDTDGRVRVAESLIVRFAGEGIALDRVWFDPLIRPAGTNPGQVGHVLEAVRHLRKSHPKAHVSVGLSNVSYGLPKRKLLNAAFLAMAVAAGTDAAIIDPLDVELMRTLRASLAVVGVDEYGMDYIAADREGRLD